MTATLGLPPEQVVSLLREAGLPAQFRAAPLRGGGNNRVYRLDFDGPPAVLLKAYFRHPDDPRDRLGAEFAFCQFAWGAGLRCLPRPLARDGQNHLGLYEFIEGRPIAPDEVGPGEVGQAMDFFRQLNAHPSDPAARSLPDASEASFSLAQHLARVDRRLARLRGLDQSTPAGAEAGALVEQRLLPRWDRVRAGVLERAAAWGVPPDEPIADADRCLSPSDFGFHNALRESGSGRLRFLDFEYAGRDDPAKTVCDFFCQPAVPVPEAFFGAVTGAFAAGTADPAWHRQRVAALLPVYRVKWCCIMLNEFLPVGDRRRAFAREHEDQEARRRAQLEKARASLERIEASWEAATG